MSLTLADTSLDMLIVGCGGGGGGGRRGEEGEGGGGGGGRRGRRGRGRGGGGGEEGEGGGRRGRGGGGGSCTRITLKVCSQRLSAVDITLQGQQTGLAHVPTSQELNSGDSSG